MARVATVFGGSGFIGRHVVQRLARDGWIIRVAVRRPSRAQFLKTAGDVGQITPVRAKIQEPAAVAAAVEGAEVVINLTGILFEKGEQRFAGVHAAGAETIARAARDAGAKTFVHLSAIGADPASPAEYARSKYAGEMAVREAFPEAAILRPSIVFGPEDDFFNRFAEMSRFSPVLPLVGGGHSKFQPVYVGDVAAAVARCVEDKACRGQTYELGGPAVHSFKELLQMMLRQIGRSRLLVPLPFAVASLIGSVAQVLPKPPLTPDQVKLLQRDNVVSEDSLTLSDLGITPTGLDVILPTYLDQYRLGGRFNVGQMA